MESPEAPPAPLVSVRDLCLTLTSAAGTVNILRGLDLDIPAGAAFGLVGPSGSGKTSLLMLLAGLERATSGTIRFDGSEITRLSEDALARLRRRAIGIVFQAFHLIPTMTALENVAVPLELAGLPDALPRAQAALAAVGPLEATDVGPATIRDLAERNVLLQLTHLRTHPAVAGALARGDLAISGWFYDIAEGKITVLDEKTRHTCTVEEALVTLQAEES